MDFYKDFNVLNSKSFALSFSTNNDSLILWSEFSNFYGYNVEYNIKEFREHLLASSKVKSCMYEVLEGKVIYDYLQQKDIIKKCFKNVLSDINRVQKVDNLSKITLNDLCPTSSLVTDKSQGIDRFYESFVSKLIFYPPFFKSPKFKNEEEYRFIFKFNRHGCNEEKEYDDELNFREKDGVIIPYIKLPLGTIKIKNIDKKIKIKHIVVGAKNNSDLAIKGTKFFLEHNGYKDESNNILRKSEITLRY